MPENLSGAAGGFILIILLLIITAAVFAIKFALDIAVNKRFAPKYYEEESSGPPPSRYYAVKNEPPKKRSPRPKNTGYTIIPQDKLFILENPADKNRL